MRLKTKHVFGQVLDRLIIWQVVTLRGLIELESRDLRDEAMLFPSLVGRRFPGMFLYGLYLSYAYQRTLAKSMQHLWGQIHCNTEARGAVIFISKVVNQGSTRF